MVLSRKWIGRAGRFAMLLGLFVAVIGVYIGNLSVFAVACIAFFLAAYLAIYARVGTF